MENTTQPILCCVGQRVAGKPTQFLMERAFAAHHLDWRAITVEVDATQFPSAVAGMLAMKFQAVRFFPSLQAEACALLAAENSVLQFVGGITSAASSAGSWLTWHNLGPAARDWAAGMVDFGRTTCWLQGDSLRCRSFLASLVDYTPPHSIYWTSPPQQIPEHLKRFGSEGATGVELQCIAPEDEPALKDRLALDDPDQCILIVGDSSSELLKDSEWCAKIPQWLVFATDSVAKAMVSLKLENCNNLSEIEQILACETYDFQRWTGHQVDRALLREAYDEYNDF